jgi:tetratricopeptide (TPR) repeat protein
MMTLALAMAAIAYCLSRDAGVAELVMSALSLGLVWVGSVLAHELGHVAAARAVGLQTFILLVGAGPSLFRRQVAGVAVDIGCLPGSGLTMFASHPQRSMKWRLLAGYAGGPLVSGTLFAAGSSVWPQHWMAIRNGDADWILPGAALVLVNGLLLFTSIVPMPTAKNAVSPRNDLLQMLTLPWLCEEQLAAVARAAEGAEFARHLVLRDYAAAFAAAHRRLQVDPANWMVRLQLADMLIFAGRYAEAAAEYGVLLAEPALAAKGIPPLARAMVANNHAWANYMLGDPAKIAAADRSSLEAISAAPDNPSVLGTRGAILLESGSLTEARKLLKRALRLHRDARSRASNLACLAIASARQGQRDEARIFVNRARQLDSDCDLLERAEAELSR